MAYYTADHTRPLSIVNTDNRLVANAARMKWEHILNEWVSPSQRGFLPARSMLANIVDVDWEAMRVSLQSANGAVILFDFNAAFPSLSHEYIFTTLQRIGVPEQATNLIRALYHNSKCEVALQGQRFGGFPMMAGIRQSCPLSPLIFVVVVDTLLRRILAEVPSAKVRGYADDIALVTEDLLRDIPALQDIFARFAAVSGLHLNFAKTVIIPLGYTTPDQLHHHLHAINHPWAAAQCASHSAYLGITTGYGRGNDSWSKPLAKAQSRATIWPWSSIGLQYAAKAYNFFVLPTLGFVAQLEPPPPSVLQAEAEMLFRAAPGPRNWCTTKDLWHLQSAFGLSFRFRGLQATANAAQIRVAIWEDAANGGLDIVLRANQLREWIRTSNHMGRRLCRFQPWLESSFIFVLEQALHRLRDLGHTPDSFLDTLANNSKRPWTKEVYLRIKRSTQARVHDLTLAADTSYGTERTLHKLRRWHMPGDQITLVERILPRLKLLSKHVPPRVQTAVFNTLWNRWVTAGRFQKRGHDCDRCLLGCITASANDSIEHYLVCPVVLSFARTRLSMHLDSASSRMQLILAALPPNPRRAAQWWAKCALLIYSIYRTTNTARHRTPFPPGEARRALQEALYEDAKHHPTATRLADNHIPH